jgi:hypothetical protein
MIHPFEGIFRNALSRSTAIDNLVLAEARALHKKGYKPEEIFLVLKKMQSGLLRDEDIEIMDEVLEEFGTYIEE